MHITLQSTEEGNYFWNMNQIDLSFHGILIRKPCPSGTKVIKFVYSEKATIFCEISTLLLSTIHTDKSKVEISQNFVAFSEYMYEL